MIKDCIACCLVRGRFGLAEIEEASYSDPALLALARKVDYEIDPHAGFPKLRSGEVIVELRDGRKLSKRESIDPDEPAPDEAIIEKFMQNTGALMPSARARRLRDVLLALEDLSDVRMLTAMLAQSGAV
jgi:2-methylcitrate dehydratase PrpD